MDQSYSESDISLSPSQILERLQLLRQLQLMQRGKLQKQRLEYQESPKNASSITEIVSHFSNSTSYNTFRSLLHSQGDSSVEASPNNNACNLSSKVRKQDLIDGVSMLNVSQESEFILNSPTSTNSRPSTVENNTSDSKPKHQSSLVNIKKITLDEMPILSPKKNFEQLILEKIESENSNEPNVTNANNNKLTNVKRPFLKRGEGLSRFGVKKDNQVIQNTKSLPWVSRKKKSEKEPLQLPNKKKKKVQVSANVDVQILVPSTSNYKLNAKNRSETKSNVPHDDTLKSNYENKRSSIQKPAIVENVKCKDNTSTSESIHLPKGKHPVLVNKGKTWAAVLNKQQDDFLRQLKQSEYYKNFASPTKSVVSDVSCDESQSRIRHEKETAEQNLFELLERKTNNESFNIENSFFSRFLKRNNLECSGESTPLMVQKCLTNNPDLMRLFPILANREKHNSNSDFATCGSECTNCCNDDCSSVASSCSCKTVSELCDKSPVPQVQPGKKQERVSIKEVSSKKEEKVTFLDDTHNNEIKLQMSEMNAKLVATGELLKDRLCELEDEIETFRKENKNLSKLREEVDLERQRFYEEKTEFEKKYNEEKILAEYYLAEEKEKLNKQKLIYDRYVREMRGRLNKKDKDEVINLKQEINDLKDEIRLKDAKSTSTIARLRNQIKIIEKEKKNLEDEVEKLKKENRRIQHNNDMTRRLSNIKYLEEINKKLSNMASKENLSQISTDKNMKYVDLEHGRQSRSKTIPNVAKDVKRPRAKSVPNLKVTSRYAKYFSQRDAVSQMERNNELLDNTNSEENVQFDNSQEHSESDENLTDTENVDHLEKLYSERFQSVSPKSNRSSLSNSIASHTDRVNTHNPDGFFIQKFNTTKQESSPNAQVFSSKLGQGDSLSTKSNTSSVHQKLTVNTRSNQDNSELVYDHSDQRSKSPISILSNRSSSFKSSILNQYTDVRMSASPEPPASKSSSVLKTNLNPTEFRKSDGSRELRFPNGNIKHISADGKYTKFIYYNGDVKENFYNEGRIKYFYAETKTYHTTHADGLEVLEFPDGQVEKRYKDGSTEIRLPNGSIRYYDPKNEHVHEEWRFPDGTALTVSANGDQRIAFPNGQIEVHTKDHKRREYPDGTVKLVYNDGTSETRYSSGRVRIKDKNGQLIMDSTAR